MHCRHLRSARVISLSCTAGPAFHLATAEAAPWQRAAGMPDGGPPSPSFKLRSPTKILPEKLVRTFTMSSSKVREEESQRERSHSSRPSSHSSLLVPLS